MFGNPSTNATGFSFGSTPASGGGGQPGQPGGFSFGSTPGAASGTGTGTAGGFSGFGLTGGGGGAGTSAATPQAATGFNFGAVATKASTGTTGGFGGGGFSFGAQQQTPATQASTGGGLSLGVTPSSGGGASVGFNLSTPSSGATGFGFKPPTATTTTAPAGGGFAGFGATATSTTGGTGGSLLGGLLASTSTTTGGAVQVATTSAAPTAGFSFGAQTSTAPAASSAATPSGFSFGATSAQTTAAAPSLGTGATAPSLGATAPSFGSGLALKPGGLSVTSSSSAVSSATAATSGGNVVASSSGTSATTLGQKQMTFRQLEDTISKWTTELEEQEKYFLDQATQVNAWDRIVMENGEKIIQLNKDVEKVKLDQQKLDHELDFVHSQQRELEDLITPLEKALDSMPPISYQQHADVERENTYVLAESLDAQLKRMGQDLKEIIERLNSNNTAPDPNDPVQQITKILNAHVVSLMWVDRNSANLQRRVEEISKQMDIEKREQERNFRLAYS